MSLPWNPGQRSLKVIGTDRDRSANYDFLLTFHSNQVTVSYRFGDKQRFRSKIAKLSNPVYFVPPEGVPWNWASALGDQKTRIMGLPGREISLTIPSAVWIHTPTWQTDRRTDTRRQQRPRLRIASLDKNMTWPREKSCKGDAKSLTLYCQQLRCIVW